MSRRPSRARGSRQGRTRGDGLRTCIACRAAQEPNKMLRVVAGPDGQAHVDPGGKAGGRGCYVCADLKCLSLAVKRRKFGRALRVEALGVQEDELLTSARAGLARRVSERLGLCQRAGRLVSGSEAVQACAERGALQFLLVASDASARTAGNLRRWSERGDLPIYPVPFTMRDLGDAVGKPPRAVMGLRHGELAQSLELELLRLRGLSID